MGQAGYASTERLECLLSLTMTIYIWQQANDGQTQTETVAADERASETLSVFCTEIAHDVIVSKVPDRATTYPILLPSTRLGLSSEALRAAACGGRPSEE